jgi:hypothetical protein
MKLLTILCSSDLTSLVEQTLEGAGIEGFMMVPDAVGVRLSAAPPHALPPRWSGSLYVVPVPDGAVAPVLAALESYTGKCEVTPCLRIIVSSVEVMQ